MNDTDKLRLARAWGTGLSPAELEVFCAKLFAEPNDGLARDLEDAKRDGEDWWKGQLL